MFGTRNKVNNQVAPTGALTTLGAGEVITVNMRDDDYEAWTGEVLSADAVAIRLRATGSRMGPIISSEDCELLIPWRRVEWIDLEEPALTAPTSEDEITAAKVRLIPHMSRAQLIANVDRYQIDMDNAKARADLRAHLQASLLWNATWDELDRRDLAAHQPVAEVAS